MVVATNAARKPGGSRPAADPKRCARSRVSNGRDVLPDIDGRSIIARRYRDLTYTITADMGGSANCSETRAQLIRRFAASAVLAEQIEAKLARGEAIDIAEHALLCSTLVRIAQRIGINRLARDVTPDPLQYAEEHRS